MKIDIRKLADNVVGEYLRSEFFRDPWYDWKPQIDVVVKTSLEKAEWIDGSYDILIYQGSKIIGEELVKACWYWDEDYYLSFELPDGTFLINSDAKKDRGWKRE